MKNSMDFAISILLVFFILSQVAVQGKETLPRTILALPPLTKAPDIDGNLTDSAWFGAALIQGFNDPRRGETRIGYDNEFVYISVG